MLTLSNEQRGRAWRSRSTGGRSYSQKICVAGRLSDLVENALGGLKQGVMTLAPIEATDLELHPLIGVAQNGPRIRSDAFQAS